MVRGWQFSTPGGIVFLVQRDEEWFVAFESVAAPSRERLASILSVIGFVIGEPLNVGILHAVGSSSISSGMVHHLISTWPRRAGREAPTIPIQAGPDAVVAFIERLAQFEAEEPGYPLSVAVHQYFWSLIGAVDNQLLLGWVGAEAVAKWAIRNGRVRVARRENPVQGFFRSEGILWTPQMTCAKQARNRVAHEGAMATGERDWDVDLSLVGLVRTMLTALMARLVGYAGPIADREKTHDNLTGEELPAWWPATSLPVEPEYVDEAMRAELMQGGPSLADSGSQEHA